MMECWNYGFQGILSIKNGYIPLLIPIIPLFQYSIIPCKVNKTRALRTKEIARRRISGRALSMF
jgi:hypothetical protein